MSRKGIDLANVLKQSQYLPVLISIQDIRLIHQWEMTTTRKQQVASLRTSDYARFSPNVLRLSRRHGYRFMVTLVSSICLIDKKQSPKRDGKTRRCKNYVSPVSTDPNKFWPHFHHAILCTCDWADPGAKRCWRRFDIFCQPYGRKANHAWPESVERVHRISISLKATNPACSNIINPLIQERLADNFSLML